MWFMPSRAVAKPAPTSVLMLGDGISAAASMSLRESASSGFHTSSSSRANSASRVCTRVWPIPRRRATRLSPSRTPIGHPSVSSTISATASSETAIFSEAASAVASSWVKLRSSLLSGKLIQPRATHDPIGNCGDSREATIQRIRPCVAAIVATSTRATRSSALERWKSSMIRVPLNARRREANQSPARCSIGCSPAPSKSPPIECNAEGTAAEITARTKASRSVASGSAINTAPESVAAYSRRIVVLP